MKSDAKNLINSADAATPLLSRPLDSGLDASTLPAQHVAESKVLPSMATFEDAEAWAVREKDAFYLAAFFIQVWLSGLLEIAAAQYAENKNPRERCMQTGQAWQGFVELFGAVLAKSHGYILSCLLRFSRNNNAPGNSLRTALIPLSIEHDCTGDFFGPRTFEAAREPQKFNDLARRTLVRWCDWLDAAVHLRTHHRAHIAPASPASDPETHWLADLANAERRIAPLSGCAQLAWLSDFASAAAKYKDSPKWATVGKAMSDDSDNVSLYVDVDTLVIALWPLVKAYRWTYSDLLHAIRPALERRPYPLGNSVSRSAERSGTPVHQDASQPALHWTYPCAREQEFASYCANVLGLRKDRKGVSSRNGHPIGYDIALRYCPSLAGRIP